jgi:hypothetical protein
LAVQTSPCSSGNTGSSSAASAWGPRQSARSLASRSSNGPPGAARSSLLGFACARGELSTKAQLEILRSSQTDAFLVPLGGDELQALLDDAERLDERLAEMVIAAAMA